MEHVIAVSVRNKVARNETRLQYVCGNSDYVIDFSFDEEWGGYATKTARFVSGGEFIDVVFSGNRCKMPVITDTYTVTVGVFAGNLKTSTPAVIMASKSILCGGGIPADPLPDVYAQIMERLNAGGGDVTDEQIAQAVEAYMAEHPVQVNETDPTVPEWAKQPEKPTYTAEEIGALPADTPIPAQYVLPVASADTLGGVKVGEGLEVAEDGTVGVVPEGEWEIIERFTLEEEGVKVIAREAFPDGTPYSLSAAKIIVKIPYPIGEQYGTQMTFFRGTEKLGVLVASSAKNVSSSGASPAYTFIYQMKPNAGLYEAIVAKGGQGGEMAVNYPANGGYQAVTTDKKIDSISYNEWTQDAIKVGTTFEIWGVRANA